MHSTYLVKEGKFDHIREALHLPMLVDVLHRQDALVVVRQVDLGLDPGRGRLTTVTDRALFVLVLWDLDVGRLGGQVLELCGDPCEFWIL